MSYQCKRCFRHLLPVKILRIDPKTKKRWLIDTCPACDYKSDLEEQDFNTFPND